MRRRMSAKQWIGWKAWLEHEKFAPTASAWHAAVVAKAIYDALGVTRKDGTKFSFEDFMLREAVPAALIPPRDSAAGWKANLAIAHVIARAQNHIAAGGK